MNFYVTPPYPFAVHVVCERPLTKLDSIVPKYTTTSTVLHLVYRENWSLKLLKQVDFCTDKRNRKGGKFISKVVCGM